MSRQAASVCLFVAVNSVRRGKANEQQCTYIVLDGIEYGIDVRVQVSCTEERHLKVRANGVKG